jgi:hypothetical protein
MKAMVGNHDQVEAERHASLETLMLVLRLLVSHGSGSDTIACHAGFLFVGSMD